MKRVPNQLAEIELIYKNPVKATNRPKVTCSEDAYKLFRENWDDNKIDFVEQAKLILLNRSGHVLGIVELSTGSVANTIVDPKLVFAAALKANASSIILAHNHPSGSLTASLADKQLTRRMKEAGDFLTLPLQDHLIITRDCYYSFADACEL